MPLPVRICNLGQVDYHDTAVLQRGLRAAREHGRAEDTLLVLEHDPVITCGTRTEHSDVAYAMTTKVPVVATERGGRATYHGPGQVVVYPIVKLSDHGDDVKQLVSSLEQALIDTLAVWNIRADRRYGYPGVWVEGKKIASLGLRLTKGVTFHGIALNVNCDLDPFTWFTPCGIPEVQMTSIADQLDDSEQPSVADVSNKLLDSICEQFDLAATAIEFATIQDESQRAYDADLVPPVRPAPEFLLEEVLV